MSSAKALANKIYPHLDGHKKAKEEENVDANGAEADEPAAEEKKGDDAADVAFVALYSEWMEDAFVALRVPQQDNGYDCGMYVMEFTRLVAKEMVQCLQRFEMEKDEQYASSGNVNLFGKDVVQFDRKHMAEVREKWKKTVEECFLSALTERMMALALTERMME